MIYPRGRLCGPANEFYSRSESATPDPSGNDRDAEPPPPASNRPGIGPDARSAVGGQSPGLAGVGSVVVWPVRRTLTKWRRPARRRSRRLGRDLAYGAGCWRGTWFGGRTPPFRLYPRHARCINADSGENPRPQPFPSQGLRAESFTGCKIGATESPILLTI